MLLIAALPVQRIFAPLVKVPSPPDTSNRRADSQCNTALLSRLLKNRS